MKNDTNHIQNIETTSIFSFNDFKSIKDAKLALFKIGNIYYWLAGFVFVFGFLTNQIFERYPDGVLCLIIGYCLGNYQSRSASFLGILYGNILVLSSFNSIYNNYTTQVNYVLILSLVYSLIPLLTLWVSLRAAQASYYYHNKLQSHTLIKNVLIKTALSIIYMIFFGFLAIYILRDIDIDNNIVGVLTLAIISISIALTFSEMLPFSKNRPLCQVPQNANSIDNPKSHLFLYGLMQGNIPLGHFFVWYLAIIGIIFYLFLQLIDLLATNPVMQIFGQRFIYFIEAFPFLYYPFIYVAGWNSASKYKGNKIWAILTKIIIIFGILTLIANSKEIIDIYNSKSNPTYEITQSINSLKNRLPITIDNETELIDISEGPNVIVYSFKISNQESKDINKDVFEKNIKTSIERNVCNIQFIKMLLTHGYVVAYNYLDKNNVQILQITLNPKDCGLD